LDHPDPERLSSRVLDQALAAGADAAEVYYERARGTLIRTEDGEAESQERPDEQGIGLRLLVGQRLAFSSTTGLTEKELTAFVEGSVERARSAPPDEHATLPAASPIPDAAPLALLDPALRNATLDEKTSLVNSQTAVHDPRLRDNHFSYVDRLSHIHLASTRGIRLTYDSGRYTIWGTVRTAPGDSGGEAAADGRQAGRRLADLSEPHLGRLLADRALRMIGGHPLEAKTATVVFPPDLAASIIATLADALTGTCALMKDCFLVGSFGERIGSDLWNLIDDGTLPGGLGSAPADAEGVPCAYHHPLVNGRLTGRLHDTHSAARMGMRPTGNARRASFRSPPATAHRNLILTPGHLTPEEILAGIDHGILVQNLIPNQSIDPVSGVYSATIAGQLIERGRPARPVAHLTMSTSLADLLANLIAIAHDLEWCGDIATPTLAFEKMAIANEG
jgi:PmbA protein